MRRILYGLVFAAWAQQASAQVFTGSLPPYGATNIPVTLGSATTNLALTIPGSSEAYAWLMVRKDVAPGDSDYDFSSRLAGQTNALYLDKPEVTSGTWHVRVHNPRPEVKSFTLIVETNRTDLRTATKPVTKPLGGRANGTAIGLAWEYFRFELVSSIYWKVRVDATNMTTPDLYLQSQTLPTTTAYMKRAQSLTNDLIAMTTAESPAGIYYIGVYGGASSQYRSPYSLSIDPVEIQSLTWDPGISHQGTQIYTNFSGVGGEFFFRVIVQNPASGGWRTGLRSFNTNEANVYLSRGKLPTPDAADFKSELPGSDGMVLSMATQASPNEEWYLLVRAKTNSHWTLVTGTPFVTDLGQVGPDETSGSGEVEIGPEGYRFFTATVPPNMLAWRLWLYGNTNSVLVKKTGVPLATSTLNEAGQTGQLLVVPPYLGAAQYFIGIPGTPHTTIKLDSRQHAVTELAYGASLNSSLAGYGYATYRIQVPPEQVAWQMFLTSTNGNANFCVRPSTVPNETNNIAYSELAATNTDHVTLVPPVLSDGAFYVTIYTTNFSATNLTQFGFQNRPAVVTDIPYTSAITNDEPNRVGWRFYRVTDIPSQLQSLGWDLFLENFAPGTRIALRRNAAPSLWSFRNPLTTPANYYDLIGSADFLQSPDQQADVWYVGVYNPTNLLGRFVLNTRELPNTPLADNSPVSRTEVLSGRWEFFRVQLTPEDLQGGGSTGPVLGWDIRLVEVNNGTPKVVVRRERYPASTLSSFTTSGFTWPSGATWAADKDWTKRSFSADGATNEDGRILAMGVNHPLEPGTYYIGVLNNNPTNTASYKVLSRWIGPGRSIPVHDLAFAGGAATNTLPPREAAYYRVVIPPGTPSWKARLTPTAGEALLVAATNFIPGVDSDKRMQKQDKEQYVMLPPSSAQVLRPGTNFLVAISEGATLADNTRIGTGQTTFVIESLGTLPDVDLGLLHGADLVTTGSLEGGESIAYRFQTHPGILGFWIVLEGVTGLPAAVSRPTLELADPGLGGDLYGNEGGKTGGAIHSFDMITVADPGADERIMIKARGSGYYYTNATYTLRVKEILPEPLPFDGGAAELSSVSPRFDRFFRVDVPPDAAGWDIRLKDVTSGTPTLAITRDWLPIAASTEGFNSPVFRSSTWPSGARWAADLDWTERVYSPEGLFERGRVIACGMKRPLEPGVYYVGVLADGQLPVSCGILSRGIGTNYTVPVTDLAFAGGSASVAELAPREAAYFRIEIPANTPSWKLKLAATNGESLLIVLKDTLPNVGAALSTSITNSGGRKMQKLNDEHFLLLPYPGQTNLIPGSYYVAVVSEGQTGTNNSYIGGGTSGFTITSVGSAPITYLGDLAAGELVNSNSLASGEVRIYQFNVPAGVQSLDARLDDRAGNPMVAMIGGTQVPDPGAGTGNLQPDYYGNEGGVSPGVFVGPVSVSIPNPTNGIHTLVVKARAASTSTPTLIPAASYTLRVNASSTLPVEFDGGSSRVTGQPANTWRYFRVEVPTNAAGWDIRLADVTSGLPRIVVRRETLPNTLTTAAWSMPGTQTSWPTNYQWAPLQDWTRRSTSADGLASEDGRVLAMGLNRPLVPGTYVIGVMNGTTSGSMSYTLLSRGIGTGFAIPLVDLPFVGSITNSALAAREAAYYRVEIPSNTPSWKVRLSGTVGESMLAVLRGALPNFDTVTGSGTVAAGKGMQKAGNENLVLLPPLGQTNIIAGTHYLAVISEGVNPFSSSRIGSGSSAYVLASLGNLQPLDLGLVTSEDIISNDQLEGGEVKAYRFYIPPGVFGVKLSLENRAGNPVMVALPGERLPDPGATVIGVSSDTYGNDGGGTAGEGGPTIVTLANPVPGAYSLVVKARPIAGTSTYPDATYNLRLQEILAPELNFSSHQNTNGWTHTTAGLLQDNERAFFKIQIPATDNGAPVIGWKLELSQSSGQATMRVRRDYLPSDANSSAQMPFTPSTLIIAPPYLTNGTWFVEVKGTGSTAFSLTSSALELERPAWVMPQPGGDSQTPGVTLPDFADTGVGTDGVPLGGDQSIFLEQGNLHYYAVQVPDLNAGVLRAQLIAISGNPDLYLRAGAIPTLHHNLAGATGVIHDRTMLAASFTEYANWVPLDGKTESLLKPGLYYMAVRATGANARYRLVMSMGSITDLPIHSDGLTNQIVAGGDWRFYRVQLPRALPLGFNVTFSQERGDVVLYLRDTIPPGNGITGGSSDYKHWQTDFKNFGPYNWYDAPATYGFNAPPVRPGNVLYLGFRAAADSAFSVRVTTNGAPVAEPLVVNFYGGQGTTNVQPFSSAVLRVDVPPEATRWRHTSRHSTNLAVYLDQGSIPTRTGNRWVGSSANSSNSTMLVSWNNSLRQYVPAAWPWVAGHSYFLLVTNQTDAAQDFTLFMDGRNALTDDSDLDSMPDAWELYYWGNLAQLGTSDNDGDGISNLGEYLEQTDPVSAASYRARLFVSAVNGVVQRLPDQASYALGTQVMLVATPADGYSFVGWQGDVSSLANPFNLMMNSNKTIFARFKRAGDDFLSALPLFGTAATVYGTNVSFTKEPGEPNHAGNPGGKSIWWRWTAPSSGNVTLSTAGSTFSTLLGVYTGTAVSSLTTVASDINSTGGTNRSQVIFDAVAGTTYNIAVDGYNGASSRITLALQMSGAGLPLAISQPVMLEDGTMQFMLSGDPNRSYVVEFSEDLANWDPVFSVTTAGDGKALVLDYGAGTGARGFYRALPE